MRRFLRIISVFTAVVMIFTFTQLKLINTSSVVHAEVKLPGDVGERLKEAVVLYVGSSDAFVNNAQVQVDASNHMVKPVIKEGRTLVPVRFIAESLGAKVEWEEAESKATIKLEGKTVSITTGSMVMKVGNDEVLLDAAAESIGSRTFVPLRALAEALDRKVFYDRGLIVISNTADIFNPEIEKEKIDDLIARLNNLPVLGSYDKLKELFEEMDLQNGNVVATFSRDMANGSMKAEASVQADSNTSSQSAAQKQKADYSETNVQVEGVDEADVVKTDGEYIYQVNKNRIIVARAYPAEEMKIQAVVDFKDKNFTPAEMYIYNDKLIVIGNSYKEISDSGEIQNFKMKPNYSKNTVNAIVFDISDKSSIKQIKEVELEGSYVSSRRIGSALYVVANKSMNYYILNDNQDTILPTYKDTAAGEDFITIGYDQIRYFPDMAEGNYMLVAGINLDKPEDAANIQTYLGSGNNIYVSGQNLYIASSGYRGMRVKPSTDKRIAIAPEIIRPYQQNTSIYKFSLNEGKITYLTKGEVPGTVLNQFSMDENNEYFRIATTVDNARLDNGMPSTSTNNLYILDEMLNSTGQLEDIAPGERIYSVRFMGDRAYMVTFKTVDPLFAIDLKDPKKPSILGALKIPGYSNYLHPYDETHIIGFGKDTVEKVRKDVYGREIGRTAYYLGMKIAIFDVTDVSNPVEQYTEKIGDRGTESPVLSDHKALLFDRSRNLMAFPVSVAEVKGQNPEDLQYGQQVFQGAYVYNVDLEKGFQLKGKITHIGREDYLKSGYDMYYGEKSIERMLYIGDNLYSLSQGMIKANSISDLKELGEITIP